MKVHSEKLKEYAKNAVISSINVLDHYGYLDTQDEITRIVTGLNEGESGLSVYNITHRHGFLPSEMVRLGSQGISSACSELISILIKEGIKPKNAGDKVSTFLEHALDPVNPAVLNEDRFSQSLQSLITELQGMNRCVFLVPLSKIEVDIGFWKNKEIKVNPPDIKDVRMTGVSLRLLKPDEMTELFDLERGYQHFFNHSLLATVFEFEYDAIYPKYSATLRGYVEEFLVSLRISKNCQAGAKTALVMFNLDLPPGTLTETLSYLVWPNGESKKIDIADIRNSESFWRRYVLVRNMRIWNIINRYLKGISSIEQIDKCIDFIISLQSLLGSTNYPVALRAASTIGLTRPFSTDVFEFANAVMNLRNNLFHSGGDPFSSIQKNYNKDEFVKSLGGLTRACIVRVIWFKETLERDLNNLRRKLEISIWDPNIHEYLSKQIPNWVSDDFRPPPKNKKLSETQ